MFYDTGEMTRLSLRLLPCMAVALSNIIILADAAQDHHVPGAEVTTIRGMTTTTLYVTSTQTTTTRPTASAARGGTMDRGEEYLLQGCYGQKGLGDVGTILGADYTARNATAGGDRLSLSMCLEFCGSLTTPDKQPYTYAGVSDGKQCYCGTTLSPTATEAHPNNCRVPCEGNATVACGGRSSMLIYKLTTPADTRPSPSTTHTTSSNPTSIDGGNTGHKSSPGVTAAVALCSIAGFGALLFVLFLCARRWTRRKQKQQQRRADISHREEPGVDGNMAGGGAGNVDGPDTTSTRPPHEEVNTDRVEIRRLDGIVMDGHHSSPTPDRHGGGGPVPDGRRPSNLSRTRELMMMSATTGAEWRNNASPVTPRGGGGGGGGMGMAMGTGTPRSVSTVPEDAAWEDIPHTPSILLRHPDSVAQGHGLGERAWNRRRLSGPFPPAGYTWEDAGAGAGAGAEAGEEGDEDEEEVESGRHVSSPWGSGVMMSLIPPPLDLPRFGRDIDDSLGLSDKDGGLLSPRWTTWAEWSLASGSPVAGSVVTEGKAREKAGKAE